jgi:hypothetical protein
MEVGKEIESWFCYGMPSEPLTEEQRIEIIDFAHRFEECNESIEELAAMPDHALIRTTYCAMADYASGQI